MVPDVAKRLVGAGHEVLVERGAGEQAAIPDAALENAGVTLADADAVWGADVVAKVAKPEAAEIGRLAGDSVLVGFLAPLTAGPTTKAIAASGATAFAMEAVPRISRAQSMDALSSQATVERLPGRADRRAGDAALLPDADDRGGHDPAGPGARARRRRRRAAGDRDLAPPRRGGHRVRRPLAP